MSGLPHHRIRIWLLMAMGLGLATPAWAQTDVELLLQQDSLLRYSPEDRFDHSYLEDRTSYLTPRFFFLQNNQPASLRIDGQPFTSLNYWPNLPVSVGGGLFYRWLGVQLGFPVQLFSSPQDERGLTRSFILAANANLRRYGIDAHYTRHTGYYLRNVSTITGVASPPYPVRPDIRTESLGANFVFVFNHRRFSFRAAFIQTERQLKSAGSLLLMPTFNYYRIEGDSALTRLAGIQYQGLPEGLDMRLGVSTSVGLTFGYAHTFVVRKKGFLMLAALPGVTAGTNRYVLEDGTERRRERINLRGHFRAALGYNGELWYAGLASTNDLYDLNLTREMRVFAIVTRTQLFVGRRIEMPKRR